MDIEINLHNFFVNFYYSRTRLSGTIKNIYFVLLKKELRSCQLIEAQQGKGWN